MFACPAMWRGAWGIATHETQCTLRSVATIPPHAHIVIFLRLPLFTHLALMSFYYVLNAV